MLSKIKEFSSVNFSIKAITIDPGFYNCYIDYSEISKFCNDLNIEHIIRKHPLWQIIFNIRKEKNPCSLCSRMRHGIIHKICKEQNCNKIALGHNNDDVIETFLMNLLFGGRVRTFSPKSYLSRQNLYMIRPLVFCTEQEIYRFAYSNGFPICKNPCPLDKKSSREDIKCLIKNLDKSYPELKKKLFNAIEKDNISNW